MLYTTIEQTFFSEVGSLYNYSHLEDFVKKLYYQIDIFEPDNLSIKIISSSLDIKIFYWEEKSQAIIYDDMSAIFIDSRITPQIQWQDYCHELCHVLIHSGNQIHMPYLYREYQEFKANNFMYHAAIPTFMLNNLVLNDCTMENVRLIQQLFNVEEDFAMKRLNQYIQRKHSILNWNSLIATH